MDNNKSLLDELRIASPCSVSWASMTGDDRVRACAQCRLSVYNVSEMTRAEAEALIREKEGRLCVRIYRRADGTILTRDCPVGLRAARLKLLRWAGVAAALIASAAGGLGLRRTSAPPISERRLMGEAAVPEHFHTAGTPVFVRHQ
ncbi:MAG TPA: hypothetical protein VN915_11635 [Elusimicrobiota bacterium]|nr:hypothetical protein [Elusimicrobiota bacterium]